jgi:hypothetical protein
MNIFECTLLRYMKKLLLLCPILIGHITYGQARLVMSGASYIVIDNSAKLVVENPATNAITNTGTGGIMTENEFDQVVWFVGTGTGGYTVPFVSQASITQIPFTATIGTAGTGAGTIRFSTYPGATWNNDTYRPSDVTHMFDYNTNSVNNSNHVIDRFWIVDALGYGTKPSATFTFTYRDAEHLQAGNSIIEADLGAQRFHPGPNLWGDYLPQGTTNVATNQTSGVPVVPAEFWRSWTLSEITNPLSVELTYFKAICNDQQLKFTWQTISESDVDHFEIEHLAGQNFEVIGMIAPLGGTAINTYQFTSEIYRSGTFRLVEVDSDGNRIPKSTLQADCSDSETMVSFDQSTNTLFLQFEGLKNGEEALEIFDATGRVVFRTDVAIQYGANFIAVPDLQLSHGFYAVRIKNGLELISEQIIKAN